MRKSCITVVACSYGLSPDVLLLHIKALARKVGVIAKGVIVANGETEIIDPSDSDWEVIKGSNRVHDFSAYSEGLAYLQDNGECDDVVIFINDSLFETHHAGLNMMGLVRQLDTLKKIKTPAIAGKCDNYVTICHQNPWSGINIYVSTYCFALNHVALPILHSLDEFASTDLGSGAKSLFENSWGEGLPLNFREFLRGFLEYGPPGFRWKGHDQYKPNADMIMIKARCIYSEHRLSGEIGRFGCILPTNFRRIDRIRYWAYEKAKQVIIKFGLQPTF